MVPSAALARRASVSERVPVGARPVRLIRVECLYIEGKPYYNRGNRTAVLLYRFFVAPFVLPTFFFAYSQWAG